MVGITFWFKAYLIKFSYSITSVERISGLREDFYFSYISPPSDYSVAVK